ncbi:hypothetical protein HY311_03780 [Candidatus Nomurabacteria bacterium]|nr:hypothetical protein [Candidatus Nomurabacteria bacterium]
MSYFLESLGNVVLAKSKKTLAVIALLMLVVIFWGGWVAYDQLAEWVPF